MSEFAKLEDCERAIGDGKTSVLVGGKKIRLRPRVFKELQANTADKLKTSPLPPSFASTPVQTEFVPITDDEVQRRIAICNEIKILLEAEYPAKIAAVELFGSSVTGLACMESDADVSVTVDCVQNADVEAKLREILKHHPDFKG